MLAIAEMVEMVGRQLMKEMLLEMLLF